MIALEALGIEPDDEILTGSSVCEEAAMLREKGAQSITVVTVHGVLADQKTSSDEVVHRLQASNVDRFLFTDSVPLG